MRSQQSGFTLVELVAVIVVLGILAATALPRFVDVSREARVGVLQGVQSAMRGASVMIYAKSLAEGEEASATAYVTVKGVTGTGTGAEAGKVRTTYGYPDRTEVLGLITLDNSSVTFDTATAGRAQIQANCRVDYVNATATARPTITPTTTGC